MDFLVTPPGETSWRMEPAEFATALRARWPDAQVHENPEADPTYAFEFSVAVNDGSVDGAFGRDGQMLGLQHDVFACAEVAAWFRQQVPPEQPLLFYDPALNGRAELTPGLGAGELACAYLASHS